MYRRNHSVLSKIWQVELSEWATDITFMRREGQPGFNIFPVTPAVAVVVVEIVLCENSI